MDGALYYVNFNVTPLALLHSISPGRIYTECVLVLRLQLFEVFDFLDLLVYQILFVLEPSNHLLLCLGRFLLAVDMRGTVIVANPSKLADTERLRDSCVVLGMIILNLLLDLGLILYIFENFRGYVL